MLEQESWVSIGAYLRPLMVRQGTMLREMGRDGDHRAGTMAPTATLVLGSANAR